MEKKPRILIVDDEPINLEFFDVMLTKLGFKVELANDGEEALEKVKLSNPDLIILDNVMPKLSGWKVTRLLKTDEEYARFRDVPIIMFSEMDSVEDKIEGFELGVDDYILKPFNFSEVLARIRAVLRNRELSVRVVKRERRIAMVESLNGLLIDFARGLKGPLTELRDAAPGLEKKIDPAANRQFIESVVRQSKKSLADLATVETKIVALETKNDSQEALEIDLRDLEERFQRHISRRSEDLKGARK